MCLRLHMLFAHHVLVLHFLSYCVPTCLFVVIFRRRPRTVCSEHKADSRQRQPRYVDARSYRRRYQRTGLSIQLNHFPLKVSKNRRDVALYCNDERTLVLFSVFYPYADGGSDYTAPR